VIHAGASAWTNTAMPADAPHANIAGGQRRQGLIAQGDAHAPARLGRKTGSHRAAVGLVAQRA